MSDTVITDALVDHFKRTWAMLAEAVRNFPEESWDSGDDPRMLPRRIGYHVLLSAERYTWQGSGDDYVPNRRFRLDWDAAPLEDLPAKKELLKHFGAMEAKTVGWLRAHGDTGLTTTEPTFPWTGRCALAQALYLLRHLQHHQAELNVELRRRGLPAAEWK